MARLSRIEAWPWATQAVRDAGLTGTVRVRVTNRAGQPIPGAFVTVLTAHDPAAALTDANGRATIRNAASVPALQVKAYAAGLVYHEVHVNLAPGSDRRCRHRAARRQPQGPGAGGLSRRSRRRPGRAARRGQPADDGHRSSGRGGSGRGPAFRLEPGTWA